MQAAASKVQLEFERSFDNVIPTELPPTQLPKPEELPVYGTLWQALNTWTCTGASTPFDWDSLQQLTPSGTPPVNLCQQLLGPTWKRWYADGQPAATSVVPRQLALLALLCLGNMKIEYESRDTAEEVQKRAEVGFAAMRESAKRLRVSS